MRRASSTFCAASSELQSCIGMRVSGCRVQGSGCMVQGSSCKVQGAGCRVQAPPSADLEIIMFKVQGAGFTLCRQHRTGWLSLLSISEYRHLLRTSDVLHNRSQYGSLFHSMSHHFKKKHAKDFNWYVSSLESDCSNVLSDHRGVNQPGFWVCPLALAQSG